MKRNVLVLLLAAFTGGQFLYAAPPVVDLSPTGSAPVVPTPGVATPAPPAPTRRPVAPAVNPAGELLLLIDQLQEEVRFLRGRVEEQENQIRRMREDGRDRYRDLDRRISLLSERSAAAPSALPSTRPASSAVGVDAPLMAAATADYGSADTEAYKAAFALVRQRAFPQALDAFNGFLTRYPQSGLVANVLYWKGEVQRAKATPDYAGAQQAYTEMLKRYPDHPKAAEAYYKLGLTYEALGDQAQARQMMQAVVDRYADQSSAKLAREYLARK